MFRSTIPPPPESLLTKHYELGRQLGEGSFGVVHEAVHRATGERVAIKTISGKKLRSKKEKEMMAREIVIQEAIRHPNVCQLFEVLADENGDMRE